MENSNFNKLENNINLVITLIQDLMEENKSLKQQLDTALKNENKKHYTSHEFDKQLQINSETEYSISKEKEETIRQKVQSVLNKLNEIQVGLT